MTYDKSTIEFLPKPTHPQFKNIEGQAFNQLTVLGYAERSPIGRAIWWCECICGNIKKIDGVKLRNSSTKSCGCLVIKHISQVSRTHGLSHHPLYGLWCGMHTRCRNPNVSAYKNYGGRGIKICPEWYDFANFVHDMGDRPSLQHSLNRIDNNGDYCPVNVEWANWIDQANNTRYNHNLTFQNKTQSVSQWTRELGVSNGLLLARLKRGWDIEQSLFTPVRPIANRHISLTFNNRSQTLYEWADELNIQWKTLYGRLRRGWSIEETLTLPLRAQP